MRPSDSEACVPLRPGEFSKIRQLAYQTFGLDLRTGKETLVSTRLQKQIRLSGSRSFDEYYRHVIADRSGESLANLIDALTTNHTSFFREPAHFDFFRRVFLPAWRGRPSLDIWSAACSSGEEPYSLAMCVLDELGVSAAGNVRILASDISNRVLSKAKQGVYSAERFEGVSISEVRKHWLRGEGSCVGSYRAKTELREMIEFRRMNLLEVPAETGPFPVIFCRNVMIYFDKPTQTKVVERLAACLEPGGYLLTGHAESLTGINHGLDYVQPAIYRRPGGSAEQRRT